MRVARAVFGVVAVLVLACLTGCSAVSPLPAAPPAQASWPTARLYAVNFGKREEAEGRGFFVAAGDGKAVFVTCRHVIAGRTPIGVKLSDGRKLRVVRTISEDASSDLALLETEPSAGTALPVLKLDGQRPAAGTNVWAQGSEGRAIGVIRGTARDVDVGQVLTIHASGLGPGDSGAPLLDGGGAVVGIIRSGDASRDEAEAIPAARAEKLLRGAGLAFTSPSGR